MFKKLRIARQLKRANLVSPPLGEAHYEAMVNGTPRELVHSSFNPSWLAEMGLAPEVIVELGSYDGGDGYRFRKAFPHARIISVEADPDRFGIVQDTVAGQNIDAFNFAVCETDGEIDWFPATIDGEAHGQGSLFRHSEKYKKRFSFVKQAARPVKLKASRLDTFCREQGIQNIDFLHMDIEGAERLALIGLGDMRPLVIYLEMRDKFFKEPAARRKPTPCFGKWGIS